MELKDYQQGVLTKFDYYLAALRGQGEKIAAAQGGHDIPKAVIRRRFELGKANFQVSFSSHSYFVSGDRCDSHA